MIILLMGVTGSGKTTIGRMLSEAVEWRYFDADDFHSAANIEKMRQGVPLTDADRQPWLERLRGLIQDNLDASQPAILACSALRQSYREVLLVNDQVRLVYLKGDYDLIANRLSARAGHYMDPQLLGSQFETLEEPNDAFCVDINQSPEHVVQKIRRQFGI